MSFIKSVLISTLVLSSVASSAASFECKISEDTDADMQIMRKVGDVFKFKDGAFGDLVVSQVTGALLTYQNIIRSQSVTVEEGQETIVSVTDHLSKEISEYSISISEEDGKGNRVLRVDYPLSSYEGKVIEYIMSPTEIKRGFKVENKFEEENMTGGYVSPKKLGIEELSHIQTVKCKIK